MKRNVTTLNVRYNKQARIAMRLGVFLHSRPQPRTERHIFFPLIHYNNIAYMGAFNNKNDRGDEQSRVAALLLLTYNTNDTNQIIMK